MTLFAAANVTINRGSNGESRSRGAFVSIIITFLLSLLIWAIMGIYTGFLPITRQAIAWFTLAGLLTVLIGRVFLYASIQALGAVRGSAVKRLNPVFSVILAVLLLHETVSGQMAIGAILIFASFGVLVHETFSSTKAGSGIPAEQNAFSALASRGYLYGPLSALAYASGYVARKMGLVEMPDAVFGTMIGALTGIVLYFAMSTVSSRYRDDLYAAFTIFNPWLLAAGLFGTLGQICYFVALTHIGVSKIALITSMEVFVTMFLSRIVFRGRVKMTGPVILAAVLGLVGSLFVIRY